MLQSAFLRFLGLLMMAVAAALVGFVLFGEISWRAAALIGVVLLVVIGLGLHRLFQGFTLVREGAERLAEEEVELPEVATRSATANDLWNIVAGLVRRERVRVRKLARQLEGTETILAALPDPLILVNDRREIVRANRIAANLFFETSSDTELRGRDLAVVLRNPAVLAATDAVLRGERGTEAKGRVVEFTLATPVERHFEARIEPLGTRGEDGAAVLVTLHDMTSIRRTEQMRADFVANASHELRTPLATLIGFIETLRGPAADDPDAQQRFLSIMQQQAGRMARLIEDLLSLSRIELNEHLPPTDALAVGPLLRSVTATLELKAAERDMQFALDVPDDLPPVIGNADELAQVFQNLCDNAIKYGRKGTAITLSISRSGRVKPAGLAVAVRDQGEGIERVHIPRLTERFYRVDTARSREMGGTGLGLAIVKHIVNRHRGVLEIDSDPGRGSSFTIHLRTAPKRDAPVRGGPAAKGMAQDASPRNASSGRGPAVDRA
jgi:two-component system phosphate regulon sensor histidine kinase PhoR